MPIRRRAWLTREGWYYLAVLLFVVGGAVLRSVNLLVMLAGMLIAPVLFNWRLAMASLTGVVIRRKLPQQIVAGQPLTVEIEFQNTRAWMSSWLVVVEDWVEREEEKARSQKLEGRGQKADVTGRNLVGYGLRKFFAGLPSQRLFRTNAVRCEAQIPHVPANGQSLGTYRLTLFRRGRYRFGPLRISTRFPLGLVRAHVTLPSRSELIVAPQLGRLHAAWASLLESEQIGDERQHPQRGVSDGDYYGLRPWQSGDSLRWIHWRTTAKMGRPIVRQFERRRGRDVAIVLDPWLPNEVAQRDEGLAELAMSLAATAIHDLSNRALARITLAIAGDKIKCHSGPASSAFCEELLALLAEFHPAHHDSLADCLDQALAAAPRGARFVIISSRCANHPSLAAAELTIDPQDLSWIDVGSEELATLFTLDA